MLSPSSSATRNAIQDLNQYYKAVKILILPCYYNAPVSVPNALHDNNEHCLIQYKPSCCYTAEQKNKNLKNVFVFPISDTWLMK